jgi:anti-sigma regulatory factor (Ser/Thr protein kinase)
MAKQSDEIRDYLLQFLARNPDTSHLVATVAAEEFGVTRQAVNRHLRRLVEAGRITAKGATRRRRYELVRKTWNRAYDLSGGLEEHVVWRDFAEPVLVDLSKNIHEICAYGFSEILNNAIEHSEGKTVEVSIVRSAVRVSMAVGDDGVGIYRKLCGQLGLEDERHAILELFKGKLTTDPRHTGEGIFFTSRAFDSFTIWSGKLYFRSWQGTDMQYEVREERRGTAVTMGIGLPSTRRLKQVFDQFTAGEEGDYSFNVTHVPVALARYGEEHLVSRSQARRLLARLDRFKRVLLDFRGIETIGQAFADEVFRVYAREHPDVVLLAVHASPAVEQMIWRAKSQRE